ncbi:flagellar biosynthesis protein FlhB [Galenea microaerophila]
MAENEDGSEKTEDPSEKKLREAREKGQIPRSRELTTLLMTLSAALYFLFFGQGMMEGFITIMTKGLSFDRSYAFDLQKMAGLIFELFNEALIMSLPFLFLMVLIAIVSPMLLGGWSFSTSTWVPKLSKLNPISGFKRMFSLKALMELLKALAKFLLVTAVATYYLYSVFDQVLAVSQESLYQGMLHSAILIMQAFVFVSLSLLIVAMIDVPFQLWEHTKQLKMTKQEVKEEFKQQEGNPEVKGRIRQLQRQMAQQRMMQKVPEADVIVTNPTHFAVALKYDPEQMQEPVVVAMGADFMASQIRVIAQEHNIPVVEAPPLARALYYNAEIDQPIPYELFKAVAAILAYVFQLRQGQKVAEVDFNNLPIPEALQVEQ